MHMAPGVLRERIENTGWGSLTWKGSICVALKPSSLLGTDLPGALGSPMLLALTLHSWSISKPNRLLVPQGGHWFVTEVL